MKTNGTETLFNILKTTTAQTRKKIVRLPAGAFWKKILPGGGPETNVFLG